MYRLTEWRKTISLLAILTISPLFTACGGDEEDESEDLSTKGGSTLGAGLMCFAYLLVSGDDECISYVVSSSPSVGSSSSSSSGGSGGVIMFSPVTEYEPNDDMLNANILEFPRTADRDGVIIDGSTHDIIDRADTFTFSRRFSRFYAFRLCSDGQRHCDEAGEIDTLTAYVDILDQSGRVVASTQVADSNYLRLELSGGIPHYVRVVAADTMAVTVKYHLVVHEANF